MSTDNLKHLKVMSEIWMIAGMNRNHAIDSAVEDAWSKALADDQTTFKFPVSKKIPGIDVDLSLIPSFKQQAVFNVSDFTKTKKKASNPELLCLQNPNVLEKLCTIFRNGIQAKPAGFAYADNISDELAIQNVDFRSLEKDSGHNVVHHTVSAIKRSYDNILINCAGKRQELPVYFLSRGKVFRTKDVGYFQCRTKDLHRTAFCFSGDAKSALKELLLGNKPRDRKKWPEMNRQHEGSRSFVDDGNNAMQILDVSKKTVKFMYEATQLAYAKWQLNAMRDLDNGKKIADKIIVEVAVSEQGFSFEIAPHNLTWIYTEKGNFFAISRQGLELIKPDIPKELVLNREIDGTIPFK